MDYASIKDPATRLTLWRQSQPPFVKSKWPQPLPLTPEQNAEVASLSTPEALLTRWRELQAQARETQAREAAQKEAEAQAAQRAQAAQQGAAHLTQVSPVALHHSNLWGRYECTKEPETINLEAIIQALAEVQMTPEEFAATP